MDWSERLSLIVCRRMLDCVYYHKVDGQLLSQLALLLVLGPAMPHSSLRRVSDIAALAAESQALHVMSYRLLCSVCLGCKVGLSSLSGCLTGLASCSAGSNLSVCHVRAMGLLWFA